MASRPNIILIYTDQQRYDAVGANGNELIRTPNLDGLAAGGVAFDNAFVTCPLCVPSRVGLFTGRYNHANGSYWNDRLLAPEESDFATLLRSVGYRTGLAGKDHCFGTLLDRAFDWHRLAGHTGIDEPETEGDRKVGEARRGAMYRPFLEDPVPSNQSITARVFDWAGEFMRDSLGSPFFLWLSVPDPHPPYMVSGPFAGMYRDVAVPPSPWTEGEMTRKPYKQQLVREWDAFGADYPGGEDLARLKRIYWGMVSQIDEQVGRLLDLLRELGIEEETIVVFTSDHGDYLGDHRMIRKGPHLYDALTHVPLFIRWPGVLEAGRRSDALTANIDLFPTLLDLANIHIPGEPSAPVHGRSFASVVQGREEDHRDAVFMEHGLPGSPIRPGELDSKKLEELRTAPHHLHHEIARGRTKGLRTKEWKYCHTPGDVDELYSIEADAFELVNLAEEAGEADLIQEFQARLLDWLIATEREV